MPAPTISGSLIDAGEIALMLGLTRRHVLRAIITRPDFPAPAQYISQKTRRWLRQDVLNYLRPKTRRRAPAAETAANLLPKAALPAA